MSDDNSEDDVHLGVSDPPSTGVHTIRAEGRSKELITFPCGCTHEADYTTGGRMVWCKHSIRWSIQAESKLVVEYKVSVLEDPYFVVTPKPEEKDSGNERG